MPTNVELEIVFKSLKSKVDAIAEKVEFMIFLRWIYIALLVGFIGGIVVAKIHMRLL